MSGRGVMRLSVGLLAFISLYGGSGHAEPQPARDHVVLRTVGGDIVLALHPDVAPQTVAYVLRLARLGVYDTTHFARVDSAAVQLGVLQDRHVPLTGEQRAALRPIPREDTSAVPHRPGTVYTVRGDAPDSADGVFAILLEDAPHLPGDSTIFGEVESGFDVVEAFSHVRRDGVGRPLARLTVERAEVVESADAPAKLQLRGPMPLHDPYELDPGTQPLRNALTAALLVLIAIALTSFALFPKLSARHVRSLSLLQLLIGGFMIFMLQLPTAQQMPMVGGAVFVLLLAIFKLMGRFET